MPEGYDEALRRIEEARIYGLWALYLDGLRLEELPQELWELGELAFLHLGSNELTSISEKIKKLNKLTHLHLAGNQLTALPGAIGDLNALTDLSLAENQLTALPESIGNLYSLNTLFLANNELLSLPETIGNLNSLKALYLSNNQLSSLPETVGNLKSLEFLGLANNELPSLPETIENLISLRDLDLSGNRLTTLPESIGSLNSLIDLDLSENVLCALPPGTQGLTQLRALYLHGNQALGIPSEVLGPARLRVRGAAPAEILAYYFRSIREEKRPLLEAKVLIVGQGAVGKTSLVKRLVHDRFDAGEEKTEGIDIARWQVPGLGDDQIQVNIWDFGGQEIMHATHQFFLTRRSLYVLVLEARKGEDKGNLHYWLRIIQSFGGDSSVLVVVNKHEPPNELKLNERGLSKDFAPNVKGFFQISCRTGNGIEDLKVAISKEIRKLDHVYDTVPQSFFTAKSEIESTAGEKDYIDTDEYSALCKKHHIIDRDGQNVLLRLLHDLGSVLHYRDEERPHYRLDEKHILDPEWVTNGVYKILNDRELRLADGVLKISGVDRILRPEDGYPRDRQYFILGMMRKFELCFDFPDGDQVLIPELLSPNEPELDLDDPEALRFEYHYEVLPEGILPRFIVRNHRHLTEERICWRSGALLEIETNRAIVRADSEQKRIFISVYSNPSGRRRALTVIRHEFDSIHRSLPGIKVDERVPLPGEPGVTAGYRYLLKLAERGVKTHLFEGAENDVQVFELLEGVADTSASTAMAARYLGEIRPLTENRQLQQQNAQIHVEGDLVQVAPGGNYQKQIATVDLPQLTAELAQLKAAMQDSATEPEHYEALAEVARAEKSAKAGDEATAMEKVGKVAKASGKWLLELVEKNSLKATETAVKTMVKTVVEKGMGG